MPFPRNLVNVEIEDKNHARQVSNIPYTNNIFYCIYHNFDLNT